jgi:hypothetical protein
MRLSFMSCKIDGRSLELFDIHNLEELNFESCSFTPRAVSAIRRVFRLRRVRLSGNCCQFVEGANGVDFMAALNHNHQLEEITINNSTVV